MVTVPWAGVLWFLAFIVQIGGTLAAIAMWSSKLTVRVGALEKASDEHSGLALDVKELKTTLKRAVSDIEDIMDRFQRGPQSQQADQFNLSGIPNDILARVIFDMAKGGQRA